jgi:predicted acylesterase/phospholipase RssA
MLLHLPIIMKVAYALSPGGLLLPYHLGALASLEYYKRLSPDHIMGSSSVGAIATMVHGCGLRKQDILETTITVSDQCEALGGARGRLLPLLEQQMETLVDPEEFLHL